MIIPPFIAYLEPFSILCESSATGILFLLVLYFRNPNVYNISNTHKRQIYQLYICGYFNSTTIQTANTNIYESMQVTTVKGVLYQKLTPCMGTPFMGTWCINSEKQLVKLIFRIISKK